MWLFGDSFDHYTDLTSKYDVVGNGTFQAISIGTGRFGTNNCRFTGAGGHLHKTVCPPGDPNAYIAFASMALSIDRTGPGRFGFLNLWSGTRGHVVFAREDDGSITVHRQTGNEAPLDSSGPVTASTDPGVWPVGQYTSIEVGVILAGAVYIKVNGVDVLGVGAAVNNPNVSGWTGWYIGLERSIGTLDLDDLMLYNDTNNGDGVVSWLGDLTAECVVPQAEFWGQWTPTPSYAPRWSTVKEIPPDNDVSFVESGIVGQQDYYQMTPLRRVSQGIRCMQLVITACKTGSPQRAMTGTIYDSQGQVFTGPTMPLDVTYKALVVPRPITSWGTYWDMAQVNACAIGILLVI